MAAMMDFDDLEALVAKAIASFFESEQMLLVVDANERSISHKLAEHLLRALPEETYGFNIDCEYNRRDLDPKRLDLDPPLLRDYPDQTSTWDDQGTTVYPDIIVHRRRQQENLLVIEIKKSTNLEERDRDLKKLMEFVRHPDYDYQFGLFLEFGADTHILEGLWAKAIWFHYENQVANVRLKKVYEAPLR